mgnify:CR=1 FL=1
MSGGHCTHPTGGVAFVSNTKKTVRARVQESLTEGIFRSNLVSFRFISLVYFVYSFVNCLSRAVGLEIKVIS